jgi:hypothetical protein
MMIAVCDAVYVLSEQTGILAAPYTASIPLRRVAAATRLQPFEFKRSK